MHHITPGGAALRQTPSNGGADLAAVRPSTFSSAAIPALLDAKQSAAVLNVSERKFHELRATVSWLPKPIALGPRLLRWSRVELEAAVAAAPRSASIAEPETLASARRKRIDAIKAGERS